MHRIISTSDHQGALHIRLAEEIAAIDEMTVLDTNGRHARTILKQGAFRMTLIAIAKDGTIPPHRTDATVSVHVLRGTAHLRAGDQEYVVEAGELLVIAPHMQHDVRTPEGTLLLLTVIEDPAREL